MTRIRVTRLRLGMRLALVVTGFGFLSAAAWSVALPAGLAAVGLSCLALEWVVHDRGTRQSSG